MADAVANLGTVMSSVVTIIEGNAIMLTMFVVPLVGAAIGLIKRIV